jgi:tetraacyldisaccharide-1-P 4'-kinase
VPILYFLSASTFCAALHGQSASIESYITVSDHGDISREALKLMASGDTLITTLKDFARWWRYAEIKEAIQGGRLFVMSLEVDFVDIDFKKFTLSFDKLFQFQ